MYPSTRFLAFLWSVGSVLAFSKRECLKFPLTFEMISGSGPIHSQFVSFPKYLRALFKKLTLLVLFGDDARKIATDENGGRFAASYSLSKCLENSK